MAVIQPIDALGEKVNGFNLSNYVTESYTFTTSGNITAANEWYRIAVINATTYATGIINISGAYGGYRPAVATIAFHLSGSTPCSLVQLAGGAYTGGYNGITKVRIVTIAGTSTYSLEVFYSSTTANNANVISIASTCNSVAFQAPTLVSGLSGTMAGSISLFAMGNVSRGQVLTSITPIGTMGSNYLMFARLSNNTGTTAHNSSMLVVGGGGLSGTKRGLWFLEFGIRSGSPLIGLTTLSAPTTAAELGYYQDTSDSSYYLGIKLPQYPERPRIIPLSYSQGEDITFMDYGVYTSSTLPYTWVTIS